MENEIIKIENLTKVFTTDGSKNVALQDVNLYIKKGSVFGVIGLSGAGKSTLVRCINFLEKPTSGRVYFEGKCLNDMTDSEIRSIRKEMGMIFQNFNLLEQSSVIKNVLFPFEITHADPKKSRQRARELLKLVGLENKENAYPSNLSGGQKQRVAIARALALEPKVLLCDEATSALDPKTTNQILDLLKKINKELGVTIVIITHQMSVVESICSEVAIIDQSKIAEVGYVKDIFASPKSDIGKKLIFGDDTSNKALVHNTGGYSRKFRLVFDGGSVSDPIISTLILENNLPINILFANMREVEGQVNGQMIIELPDDKKVIDKIDKFLAERKIKFEEVTGDAI